MSIAVEPPSQSPSRFSIASADAYERGVGSWSRALAPRFVAFCEPVAGRVLDVGCGTGILTERLLAREDVAAVAGIDVNADLLAHARQRIRDPRATFGIADAARLPFAAAAFDHALMLLVVNFVSDRIGAVREARRVVRPGGTVAATIWDFRGGFMYSRFAWDVAAARDPAAAAGRDALLRSPFMRPGSLAALWREAGLTSVREDSLAIEIAFDRFDHYWQTVIGSGQTFAQYFAKLAPNAQDALRDAVRATYLVGDDDGPRSWATRAFAVAGRAPG